MKILDATQQSVEIVSNAVKNDGLVVLPTDTLYGLCANSYSDIAVSKVFKAKLREVNKALPVFVANIKQAKKNFAFNDLALELANKYWPGPLTIILPVKHNSAISNLIHANTYKVAVRMPNSFFTNKVLAQIDVPLTGTSANISGEENSVDVHKLLKEFDDQIDFIVEDKAMNNNLIASTIIDCTENKIRIIRSGPIVNL